MKEQHLWGPFQPAPERSIVVVLSLDQKIAHHAHVLMSFLGIEFREAEGLRAGG